MAHIIREEKAEVIKSLAIYAILFSDSKTVFIGKCLQHCLKNTYSEHYNLRKKSTKELFEKEKENGFLPSMYLLQNVEASQRRAFRYCIAWSKYFIEHGYILIPKNNLLQEYAEDMTDETEKIFEEIKQIEHEDLLSPEKSLFTNYGAGNKKRKPGADIKITIRMSNEDYSKLLDVSKKNKMTIAAYSRKMILNGKVIKVDWGFMNEYLKEFRKTNSLLRQIIFSIYEQGQYLPVHIKAVQDAADTIIEVRKNVRQDIDETIEKLHNL